MIAPARPLADLKVALFATCFNDTMWPETPKATVRLLERLGCRVEFPMEQTCCGQMLTNTGYGSKAAPLVRRFVDVFEGYDAVVAPSGSCVGSVREQHRGIVELVGDDRLASRVEHLAPRVYELSEFLVDVLGVTDVGAYFPHRVTYHPTCRALSEPIAMETSAFFMANVPPKPQHSCAPGSSTRSMPRTARSSWSGRSPTRSIRSEWHVGW